MLNAGMTGNVYWFIGPVIILSACEFDYEGPQILRSGDVWNALVDEMINIYCI